MLQKKPLTLPKIKGCKNVTEASPSNFKPIKIPSPKSARHLYDIKHRITPSGQYTNPRNYIASDKISRQMSFSSLAEQQTSVLRHSLTQNSLPATIIRKFEYLKIRRRFKEMGEFTKRIPETDPLESLYTNAPFIDHVRSDNIHRIRDELMRNIKPVYEDLNEACDTWRQDSEVLYI
ncbi:unnamed protein product [Blepharisma stoltei]|uniref:Uncharacterized protein n=1 Tax=Blepharisma stoltei TaxID=1481888 RepID=A0AAU9JN25_9CILI|nr:unnamed protein product [Blepharisma stoltei]